MVGRCGSSSVRSRPASVPSSASDPITVTCSAGHRQIGSGVPQYRSRESAQSTLFSSQFPNRPLLDVIGMPVDPVVDVQEALLDGRGADVPGGARVIEERGLAPPAERIRVQDRPGTEQASAGREVLDDHRDRRPSRTDPRMNSGARSVKRPSSPTGLKTGQPWTSPTSRSSAPNAGARCTIARAVLHLDERARHDAVRALDVRIGRLVPRYRGDRPRAGASGSSSRRRGPPPRAVRRRSVDRRPSRPRRRSPTHRPPRPCWRGASMASWSTRAATRRPGRRSGASTIGKRT